MILAMIMFVVKPFVGFSLQYQHYFRKAHHLAPNILAKSFTKPRVEFSESNEYNMTAVYKLLANPALPVLTLLAFALNIFLPRIFKAADAPTYGVLATISCKLHSPQPLYLLDCRLTI